MCPLKPQKKMQAAEAPKKMKGFRSLAELQSNFQSRHVPAPVPQAVPEQVDQIKSSSDGVLTKVFQGKGFGFIAPDDGSKDVFIHFRDIMNGGCKDLVVGTQLHFHLVIEDQSGNRKAKNATVKNPKGAETSIAPESPSLIEQASDSQLYSQKMLLNVFGALRKTSGLLKLNPCTPTTLYMPRPGHGNNKKFYEEDPNLNDENCVIRLEMRLSKESGADANNVETFGDCAKEGWSFEQALEANSKLDELAVSRSRFGSGSTAPDSASEHECAFE